MSQRTDHCSILKEEEQPGWLPVKMKELLRCYSRALSTVSQAGDWAADNGEQVQGTDHWHRLQQLCLFREMVL